MATDTHGKQKAGDGVSPAVQRTAATHGGTEMHRWQPDRYGSSLGLMRQMQDELDRWFGRLGLGGWSPSNWPSPSHWMARAVEQVGDWAPAVDAFQRGNEFVVRADIPGMTRNDVSVEIGEDSLTIRGERKDERREERDGTFWSERTYGSFCRVVPLPPGAISDSAKANFHNGVLEIVVESPSQETRRGRRVDITAHDTSVSQTKK